MSNQTTDHANRERPDADLDRLRGENQRLADELAAAQRAISDLSEMMESSIGRTNSLVLEAELSNLVLEEIFNTSHDAIWVLDHDCKIVRVNKRMASILGKSTADLIGQCGREVLRLPACGTDACVQKRLLSTRSRKPVSEDVELALPGQAPMSCILSASVCYDPCGEVLGIVETYKDITARRQAEAALQEANENLARLSRTDGLTNLANRRHFDETLQSEWARHRREQQPLSLLMVDVDFFKRYNDTYGHQAGDQCLASVAAAIRSQVRRPADLAARYGGEEFAAILPNTVVAGGRHVAEHICAAVGKLAMPHSASAAADHVTVSIGVAGVVPGASDSAEDLLKRADQALYQAKEKGRNRSVAFA